MSDDTKALYRQTCQSSGWWDASDRTSIEITGSDRETMLQGFCTTDILKLAPLAVTETFIPNVKGKVLGYVRVLKLPESLMLESEPNQAERLIQHLDKYVIREKAYFHDRSSERKLFCCVGPAADSLLGELFEFELPREELQTRSGEFKGETVLVTRTDEFSLPAFRVDLPTSVADSMIDWLIQNMGKELPTAITEFLRIAQATPAFGIDVTEENLPQEVQRDQQAISFTKGCYLGQETVARIDALGHVNRVLVLFESEEEIPFSLGDEIMSDEKRIGHVTSCIRSPESGHLIGMAYVRRGNHKSGTTLTIGDKQLTIVDRPLANHPG